MSKLRENIFLIRTTSNYFELLRTTSGCQQFAKIRDFKVDNFVLPLILAPKLR